MVNVNLLNPQQDKQAEPLLSAPEADAFDMVA
jgi:hypothetical protein